MKIRAITVSVDYADILAMTLPSHRSFVESTMVVTTGRDERTIEVARQYGAQTHVTDAFYRREAKFNKFAALEEALDAMGREGWILIIDADIVIPVNRPAFTMKPGFLYTAHRRIKSDISDGVPEQRLWKNTYKRPMKNEEFCGYFQLFHADDAVLGPAPWHETNWTWAGGADSYFHAKWPDTKKIRPPFEVLHLGKIFKNWTGRVTPYADGSVDPQAAERAEISDRLFESRKGKAKSNRYINEKLEPIE